MKKIYAFALILTCLFGFCSCMGDMSIYTKNEQDEYMSDALFSSEQKTTHTMHIFDVTYNDWFGNEKMILNFSEGKTDKECIPSYTINYDEKALTLNITLKNVSGDNFIQPKAPELNNIATVGYNSMENGDFSIDVKLNNKVEYRVDETKEYSMLVICLVKK